MKNVKVLIPLQLASTRVKQKNIRPFYKDKSLFSIKIEQLINAGLNPDKIYVSSEDAKDIVKESCKEYGVNFLQRDKSLTGNAIKQGDLIGFILKQIPKDDDDILWVQVTNPLFDKFRLILDSWQEIQAQGFDSIVAVKTIRHHLLNQNGIPLNFNFGNWHKVSQDLPKIYEILWSAFLLKREAIETNKYHIGTKPYYMTFDNITTIDIDTEKDFELARQYYALINGGGGQNKYDVITAFHVIEHLQDPLAILQQLASLLKENGKMIIEVPNANDALLTIFKNKSYQDFIYWSAHLYYFTPHTLTKLGEKAGLKVEFVKGIQRYSFANNLYWLAFGKPAGEKEWENFIDDTLLQKNWESTLASLGATDTLMALFSKV